MGMTQAQLASAATTSTTSISAPSVSQMEAGRSRPDAVTLVQLAKVLEHPVAFFVGAKGEIPDNADALVYWRRLTSTPARERRRAAAFARYASLLLDAAEKYGVAIAELTLPSHELDESATAADAEQAARQTRQALGLGLAPLPDVVGAVERGGVIVIRAPYGTFDERVDAFSTTDTTRPLVVLGTDKDDWNRSRFDGAHEAGHVVMHRHSTRPHGQKWEETQAHAFAAEFLMPAEAIEHDLPRKFDVGEYLALKQHWGVSIQALVRRARDLGRLSQAAYVSAQKRMSVWGWRTPNGEPGLRRPLEQPSALANVIRSLDEEGSLSAIVKDLGIPTRVVAALSARSPG
jgi:Zn-dependent peptidase ImmA (M78 family)/transcriptional regulator with XRE-family HTH domain